MMPTKRTNITRPPVPQITDRAMSLYKQARALKANGQDRGQEYITLSWELCRELGLRPWDHNPLDVEAGEPRPGWVAPDRWHKAQQLRASLEGVGDANET